jgi:hypothetical protein
MPISQSILAYNDVRDTLDKAVEAERGIKLTFERYGDAIRWRYRAGKYRSMIRRQNMEVYDKSHALHGRTPYDEIEFKLKTGPLAGVTPEGKKKFEPPYEVWCQKYSIDNLRVEEL